MFKACIHSNCAVCKRIEERDVFKMILQKMHPEVFICEHAMYKVLNSDRNFIIIPNLTDISCTNRGYFIKDIITGIPIFLNENNLEVICSKQGTCDVEEPYVAKYVPK